MSERAVDEVEEHPWLEGASFHEAAHAVFAWFLGVPFDSVDVADHGYSWGRIWLTPDRRLKRARRLAAQAGIDYYSLHGRHRNRIEHEVLLILAGPIAELVATGGEPPPARSELPLTPARRRLILQHLDEPRRGDLTTARVLLTDLARSDPEREAYLAWLRERTRILVAYLWPQIRHVAQELLARTQLSRDEVEQVLGAGILAEEGAGQEERP
jgi:hypothetical protein